MNNVSRNNMASNVSSYEKIAKHQVDMIMNNVSRNNIASNVSSNRIENKYI